MFESIVIVIIEYWVLQGQTLFLLERGFSKIIKWKPVDPMTCLTYLMQSGTFVFSCLCVFCFCYSATKRAMFLDHLEPERLK